MRRCSRRVTSSCASQSMYLPRRRRRSTRRPACASCSASGGSGSHHRGSEISSACSVRPSTSGASWRRIVSTSGSSGTATEGRVRPVLVREDGDAVVVIGQASHAWLSGQLARAWGGDAVAPVEPREEVCLAAEQHDVGMALWDVAPALNPETGRPRSFMEMELPVHLALWTAAPDRLLTQSRYAALLVSRHGTILYGRSDLSKMDPGRAAQIR